MRIALDAMGGDFAPAAVVQGAVMAGRANPEVEILLVGDERALQRELASKGGVPPNVRTCDAPEAVGMGEHPVSALKRKPSSSVARALRLAADGEADAVVSAGNTGAVVAGAALLLKLLDGVRRPGIAVTFANPTGPCTLIDAGANLECRPAHLVQYAIMGSVYHQHAFGVPKPRVALLSVGAEEQKGNKLVKESRPFLAELDLNFCGNVEGEDVHQGRCDVVVCDGFVGNVVLKTSEGLGENFLAGLRERAEKDVWARLGVKLLAPVLEKMKRWLDFSEYGGAPLLGVAGICIICHGRSNDIAIRNAISAAARFSRHDVNGRIVAALAAERDVWMRATENSG
jgi:glycerol-3-phosphate acyltransferase PlsX